MDAIELLKQDHQKVKQLFDRGTATEDRKQQKQIFKEIKSAVEEEDEEEGKMFPEIRDLIEHTKLEQLGEELESVKHKRLRKAG
jgi:hemerythrin superfamily protein